MSEAAAKKPHARLEYLWEALGVLACLAIPLLLLLILENPTRVQLLIFRLVSALGVSSLAAFAVRGLLGSGSAWARLGLRAGVFVVTFYAFGAWVIPALQARATAVEETVNADAGGLAYVSEALDRRDLASAKRALDASCSGELEERDAGMCAYLSARLALYQGDPERARGQLERALANEALESMRGRLHELSADITLAVVARDPALGESRAADIYASLKRALEAYEAAGQVQGQANAYLRLASAQTRFGELDDAESSLARARELYEQNSSPRGLAAVERARGDLATSRGADEDAAAAYQRAEQQFGALEDSQGIAGVRQAQAKLSKKSGDLEGAIKRLKDAEELLGEAGDTRSQEVVQTQIQQLERPAKLGMGGAATRAFEGWDCEPDAPRNRGDRKLAKSNWSTGNALFKRGMTGGAIDHYLEARRHDPSYAPAYYSLGRLAMDAGLWERAERCLQAAIQRKPKYTAAHNNLAIVYAKQDKVPQAREQLEQLVKQGDDGANAQAHYNRALVEAKQGAKQDALKHAKKAAKSARKASSSRQRALEQDALQLIQTVDDAGPEPARRRGE